MNAGYGVTVWARRRDTMAALVAAGASAGDSPADVASKSDIVMTMVTDTKAVEDVLLGERGMPEAHARVRWSSITARSRPTERGVSRRRSTLRA